MKEALLESQVDQSGAKNRKIKQFTQFTLSIFSLVVLGFENKAKTPDNGFMLPCPDRVWIESR